MRTSRYLLCVVAFFLILVSNAYCQTALQLAPVTPCRLVDTRPVNGGIGPFTGTQTFNLPTLAQSGGVGGLCTPFDLSTAQAYSLNVTVLPTSTVDYLTIWPAGQPMPLESLMNSYDGRTKANATIVPAGTNGGVSVYVSQDTGPANVLIDINAYFDPSGTNLQFFPLPPCRIVDTRNNQDGGTLQAGMERDYPIPGQGMMGNCGIPASAAAYSFNITVLPTQGSLDFLTVWPEGGTRPVVSTINDYVGDPAVANAAIVPAGTMGATAFYPNDHNTDLLIDTNGYFAPLNSGQPIPPLSLYTVTPCRVLDTRAGSGAFQGQLTVQMVNNGNGCAIPLASQAYVVNATVVPDPTLGFLTLWGQGTQPVVSTLNAYDGAVTSNLAIVPANTSNGTMLAYASDKTNLIVDAFNVMAPPVTLMLGNYAFAIRGFQTVNNVPTPFVMVGGLVADGHGNVTSGIMDLNNGSGSPMTGTTFTGTYSIDGTGVGTMQLTSTLGTFNFHLALSAQGSGQIIWDNTGGSNTWASGVFLQQNPADFTYPQAGNYAIGTLGSDFEQNRFAAAGAFMVGANGLVTSGSEDINDNGELGPLTFTGAFAHGINTLGGRNLAVFNFAGEPTNNYAYYTIYQGYVLLVSIDATVAGDPLTLSTMLVQSTSGFNQGSLTGATVYGTSALAPNNGSPAADVLLGLANWNGSGSGNFSLDENNGGTVTQQETSSGAYSVASNGRVTLSGFSVNPILYLINQDQAFVLGQDPTVAFGSLQMQSGAPFSNTSISGMYQGGTINPAQAVLTDSVAYFSADGASPTGTLTGLANTSGSGGTGTQPYSAMYSVDGTGRAVVTGTPAGFMYVVSPTQVDLLPSGTNPILNVFSIGQMY